MILIKGIKFKKIGGITLYPFVLVRPKNPSRRLINHERIHIRQQIELLVLPFYLWYITEWIIYFLKYRDWWKAYHQICFEQEAYDNEDDFEYLNKRKFWSFCKYL
ncbi:MAG: hypothetical protein MUF45_03610 [Spirosomaceae bacterium]|nr:hypothetical protein [Spirosomataceae bacterium]